MSIILNAIKENIDPKSEMMKIVSITKKGDGTSVFNKTNGKRKADEKILMESSVKEGGLGYSPEEVTSENKNTYLVGSNYQKLQNNRIKKAAKEILTAVQLSGGNDVAEMILSGILDKAKEGTAFESKGLPWGEWVEGFEGILIRHEKEGEEKFYLRVYNETNGKGTSTFYTPSAEILDINSKECQVFRKAEKKKSGKVNELKEALGKILDLNNPEIKEALQKLKPINPETQGIEKFVSITLDGKTFKAE